MASTENEQTNFESFFTAKQSLIHHQRRWRQVKFNIPSLDRITSGGINTRGIVEIAGDAGSGKTQLALHLALVSQLQNEAGGSRKGVVFISTEHPFPSKRIIQMKHGLRQSLVKEGSLEENFTDNIFLEHLNSSLSLEQCITERLPVLLENNPIGLLVIDSITSVYADEQNYVDRAHSFRKVVHSLHSLQEQFDFATICTNQVRAVIDSSTLDDARIVPALGLSWASLVHTRFQLSRIIGTNQRICQLLFSPTAAPAECRFVITETGISDFTHPG